MLERTPCFGSCPAYELTITGSGRVVFRARELAGGGRTETDTVPRAAVAEMLARAEQVGFYQLPDRPADDSTLCPHRATDHPSVIVAISSAGRAKQVHDYTGCFVSVAPPRVAERLQRLRAYAAAIDSAAGVSRWARPARRD